MKNDILIYFDASPHAVEGWRNQQSLHYSKTPQNFDFMRVQSSSHKNLLHNNNCILKSKFEIRKHEYLHEN